VGAVCLAAGEALSGKTSFTAGPEAAMGEALAVTAVAFYLVRFHG
jgi:hypothetical protein